MCAVALSNLALPCKLPSVQPHRHVLACCPGFDTVRAVALSNLTVMAGAVANFCFNSCKRHPRHDRRLIDWDVRPVGLLACTLDAACSLTDTALQVILIMEPSTAVGAVLGSYLNKARACRWLPGGGAGPRTQNSCRPSAAVAAILPGLLSKGLSMSMSSIQGCLLHSQSTSGVLCVQMLPQWLVSDLLVLLVFALALGLGRKAAAAWHQESLQKEGYQEAPPAHLQHEGAPTRLSGTGRTPQLPSTSAGERLRVCQGCCMAACSMQGALPAMRCPLLVWACISALKT